MIGILLVALLAFTPLRAWLESSMTAHMLVQLPLLLFAGWLFSARARHWLHPRGARLQRWNAGGAAGLLLTAAVTATWMIPRALDLSVTSIGVDAMKFASLFVAGVALHSSWSRAGAIGQAFFIGNVTWMMAAAGLLLRDAPVRVCTSYLTQDQQYAGTGLLLLAAAVGVRWFTVWLGAPKDAAFVQKTPPLLR